jgi:hypothetical protein
MAVIATDSAIPHHNAFFYGLFMDADILRGGGIEPRDPRRGHVDDFALQIGERATLVPRAGGRSYGMVYLLTQDELDRLYCEPGLTEYQPETVLVSVGENTTIPARCYNLAVSPDASEAPEVNFDYAKRLKAVLKTLGFPDDYVKSIG